MLSGYARVSTNETVTQVAALKAAGWKRIFREKASGGRWDKPELQRPSINSARVTCLLSENGIGCTFPSRRAHYHGAARGSRSRVPSLTEAIDTTTPAGRMMMQMVSAFAEFERAMLNERIKAGWMLLAKRDGWAAADQNLRLNNRPKSQRWFPRAAIRLRMRHTYSRSTQRLRVGSSPGRHHQGQLC